MINIKILHPLAELVVHVINLRIEIRNGFLDFSFSDIKYIDVVCIKTQQASFERNCIRFQIAIRTKYLKLIISMALCLTPSRSSAPDWHWPLGKNSKARKLAVFTKLIDFFVKPKYKTSTI